MASGDRPWQLEAGHECGARDPFGRVKPADRSARSWPVCDERGVSLRTARNGYASFRLWVSGEGAYRLSVETTDDAVEVDLFRAWYHRLAANEGRDTSEVRYGVDALVPAAPGVPQRLPDPDNAVEGQTHQEYWVDVFVRGEAPVGTATGRVILSTRDGAVELPLRIEVLEALVPDNDVVICNRHSFGCRWLYEMYPSVFSGCTDREERWARTITLLHDYFRLSHEHRGLFTNRGVGHAGTFDPIYGPALRGSGREKSIDDWTWYDRHYGPLLDGSAFSKAAPGMPRPRRRAAPVWGLYTPISPCWPADYLWWNQPGYEAEFVRCVRQFDRHFRQKEWLTSRPFFFFHHKKRYRWFEWDGDEPKGAKDDAYFLEMGRLLKKAIGDSPVPWVYRMDASWQMKNHIDRFAGMVNFWVCGGFARWYPDEIAIALDRGDIVWTYSGTPPIDAPSAGLLEHVAPAPTRGSTATAPPRRPCTRATDSGFRARFRRFG